MKISYGMTRNYRKEWGQVEAVRELVQNCLDNPQCHSEYSVQHSPSIHGDVVSICTEGFVLPMTAFALGESQKTTENPIGGFGEGFKLALMVLTREGMNPVVEFGDRKATCAFEYDDALEQDVFTITFDQRLAYNHKTEFVFNCTENLADKISVFDPNTEISSTLSSGVQLLPNHPGQVFVNGLFVCEEKRFVYGYNFAPSSISLGCDRQIANPLGLAWETGQHWAEHGEPGQILDMILDEALDVAEISYHMDVERSDMVAEEFTRRFNTSTVTDSQSSYHGYYTASSSLYRILDRSTKVSTKPSDSPTKKKLLSFYEAEKKHMRRHARLAFLKLLETIA